MGVLELLSRGVILAVEWGVRGRVVEKGDVVAELLSKWGKQSC